MGAAMAIEAKAFKVGGKRIAITSDLWFSLLGPRPNHDFECDGCSNSPDSYHTITGRVFKLWPACVIHDYHYRTKGGLISLTRDAAGRREADRIFRENLRLCIAHSGGSKFDQRRLSWLYWGRVRVWGAKAFQHWVEGAEPLGWFKRMREVWG